MLASTTGLAALSLLSLAAAANGQDPLPQPPSIVFLLVDDLGWTDLGCYGSDFHETPNIDRLASTGTLFTQAYANAPNCAPTRASLMSGQYGPLHGIYTVNSSARGRSADRKLIPVPNTTVLADEVVTIPEVLRTGGYQSAAIGKWHLGADPRTQGFDHAVGGNQRGSPPSYFSPYRNRDLPDGPGGEYLTDRLTDEAIAFVERTSGPFFLYMSYYAVHTPIQGKRQLVEKYRGKSPGERHHRPGYAAMVETVDHSVGRILAALDELDLADHTAVFLFSDNGGHGNVTDMAPLRGAKGMLYEGGIRVPLIVRWPGTARPGSRSDEPVISVDFLPTILEIAGLDAPEGHAPHGRSLVPALRGERVPDRALHWHFPAYLEATRGSAGPWRTTPAAAVRVGRHKLIEFFEDGRLELYDLLDDPGETRDLSRDLPDRVRRLHDEMRSWRERLNAPVPTERNPGYVPRKRDG